MNKMTLLRQLSAADLGLSLADLDAEKTSVTLPCQGANMLSMSVKYTRGASGAATTVSVEVDESMDGGTTWNIIQAGAVSSGVITLTDAIYRKAVTASYNWPIHVQVGMPLLRIRVTSASGVASHDQATITAQLWFNPGP